MQPALTIQEWDYDTIRSIFLKSLCDSEYFRETACTFYIAYYVMSHN